MRPEVFLTVLGSESLFEPGMIAVIEDHRGARMPPTPKRAVVGRRGPIPACLIVSPLPAPREHIMDAASEHPCLQPSDSLPKLVEEGQALSLLTCLPHAPGLPIYFPDVLPLPLH